ncbi:MAG: TonB-dependent receptor [Kordiimonadaceae bacterium]|nr:TonB-dependent receptor [Kordiimonadaceae bacterium]
MTSLKKKRGTRALAMTMVSSLAMSVAMSATAQDTNTTTAKTASGVLLEEIMITATKQAHGVAVQDVPIAITAYGASQLEALHVNNIEALSFSQPNVSLEDVGSVQGTANFSIRGLGINSSIPSIDPTVGVFVDGVYLGINSGLLFDTFDLEAVEILRGPQGVLFGRNVTGGAVLLRTKKPTEEFEASAKVSMETGLNQTYQAYVSGAVVPGVVKARISAYYNDDAGFFTNQADGSKLGQSDTFVVRPSITFTPSESTELNVTFEHGETEGHGTIAQNRALFERGTFDVTTDDPGFMEHEWNQLAFTTNMDVAFGDGVITNTFGWRKYTSASQSDFDASTSSELLFGEMTRQQQYSNEIRYAGRFMDRLNITVGGFWFDQKLEYQETRFIFQDPIFAGIPSLPALSFYGGGIQDHKVVGVFSQADFEVTEALTLNIGIRWGHEEKAAQLATISPGIASPDLKSIPDGACNVLEGDCTFNLNEAGSFDPEESWSNFSPKLGFLYKITDNARTYAHWSRGYRSGGYNLRNTVAAAPPGPFGQEKVDSYELGLKTEPFENARLNIAIFRTNISNMQREVLLSDPLIGTVQVIANTADARINGFEIDGQFSPAPGLVLNASLGYLDAQYTNILFDISGDDVVDATDLALKLPRVPKFTYNFGFLYDHELGDAGYVTLQANFNHRDEQAFTDNNRGVLSAGDMLSASLSFTSGEGNMTVSLFGTNLLNEATEGSDSQTPFPVFNPNPGSHSPLNKGRVIGASLKFDF